MIKRLLAIIVPLVLLVGVLGCGGGSLPSGGVAMVGKVVITQTQLDKRTDELVTQLQGQVPTKEQDPAAYKEFQNRVLEYLVTLEVARQKATVNKVAVTDKDIQTQIDQIKAMFSNDETAFASALKQQNLTLDTLKKNLDEQTLLNKSVEVVTKDATVTAQQIQTYYDANKSTYLTAETRTARHILFAPKVDTSTASANTTATPTPTDADWNKAKALADKVRTEIVNGADFATEAKKYSDDPGSKPQGGDLGAVPKGQMVPEFDAALFSLKKGELSQPVKTQYGYHLIEVTEITPAKQQTLADVKSQIQTQLLDQEKQKIWTDWLKKTKDELKVVYKEGMAPTSTTTTAAGSAPATSAGTGSSSTTVSNQPATTTTTK